MLHNEDNSSVWDCEDYQTRKNSHLNVLTALLEILCAQEDKNYNHSRLNLVHKPSTILSMTFFFIYAAEQVYFSQRVGGLRKLFGLHNKNTSVQLR